MTLPADTRARLLANRKQLTTMALTLDTYDWYRRNLRGERICYDEQRAAWLVFRYADVQQVLLDTASFSSNRAFKPDGSVDEIGSAGILGMDPPRHRRLRSLIARAFTQAQVAQLESRIGEITARLLDVMEDQRSVDMVDALAFPLPVMVIAELLGVPLGDTPQFRRWAGEMIGDDFEVRMRALEAMTGYFDSLIAERSRSPREDLISGLVRSEIDGVRLNREELIGACTLLVVAGHETTASLIGNALWCFDEYPQALAQVIAQPALLPGAIEEVLRMRAVVHWISRLTLRPVRFLDRDIPAGEQVLPLFAAANLDPAQFPEPDRFDIHRAPNRHLGFGFGIHLCLGAGLARLEARIALRQLFDRFPRVQRDRSRPLELRPSAFIYSLQRFPVLLQG